MKINTDDTNEKNKTKQRNPGGLILTREADINTCIWERLKDRKGMIKLYCEKKERLMYDWIFWPREVEECQLALIMLCDWFGVHIWFCVVGPELHAGEAR